MTGLLMCFLLGLIVLTAHPKIRNTKFEVFYYTHQLFIPFLALCFIHGSFCFIKTNTEDRCETGPQFWKYILFPGTLYFGERIYRMFRSREVHRILKVIRTHQTSLRFNFKKDPLMYFPDSIYVLICHAFHLSNGIHLLLHLVQTSQYTSESDVYLRLV